jgi:hypothetical protein
MTFQEEIKVYFMRAETHNFISYAKLDNHTPNFFIDIDYIY